MSPGAPLVMPTRILIVGGGGREHALAWKLSAEPGVNEVLVAPGSAAIAHEPRVRVRVRPRPRPDLDHDFRARAALELVDRVGDRLRDGRIEPLHGRECIRT